MKWEKIESAPKCGEVIIVRGYYDFERREPMLAAAATTRDWLWWRDNRGYGFLVTCQPTHWIKMPKNLED